MSSVNEVVSRLIGSGMDPAEAGALMARAAAELATANASKSSAAIRQQRYRDRNKSVTKRNAVTLDDNQPVSVTNHNETVTNHNDVTLFDNSPLSKKERKKKEEKEEREARVTRASQLSTDWRPDAESWMQSIAVLGTFDRAEYELKKFADYALEKGRVAKNWNAAWRNWAKRAVEFGGKNGHAIVKNADNPRAGSLIGAIDRRLAEIEANPDSALSADHLLGLSFGPVQRS